MLCTFTSYRQNDWDLQLSAAEFACNNAPNASTGMTPFLTCHGHNPHNPYSTLTSIPDMIPAATDFLETICNNTKIATDALTLPKATQEHHANKSWRDVSFQVSDCVLLSSNHIHLASQVAHPLKKLQPRFLGPYTITHIISPVAYK